MQFPGELQDFNNLPVIALRFRHEGCQRRALFLEVNLTLVKSKPLRCIVFIDGSNLYRVFKDIGLNCDYRKFVLEVFEQFPFDAILQRVYYYSVYPDQKLEPDNYRKTQSFLQKLERWNQWELRTGHLVYRDGVAKEKGVDTKLVSDMVFFAAQDLYDVSIVISGDEDLAYSFDAVKTLGKQIAVLKLPHNFSMKLVEKADFQIQFPNHIMKKNKKQSRKSNELTSSPLCH